MYLTPVPAVLVVYQIEIYKKSYLRLHKHIVHECIVHLTHA